MPRDRRECYAIIILSAPDQLRRGSRTLLSKSGGKVCERKLQLFRTCGTTGAMAPPTTQATMRPCGCLVRNCILISCFSCLALSWFALPLGDLRQSCYAQTDDLRLIRGKKKRNCETGPAYGCIGDLSWDLGTGVKVDAKDSTVGTMNFLWMLLSCEHDVGAVSLTLQLLKIFLPGRTKG